MLTPVSIIIPTYNRASHLQQLLQQLTAAACPPQEIIVVDDHSTDDTAIITRTIRSPLTPIIYVVNQGRQQRDGKQTGLVIASSPYISFWDDDLVLEDRHFFCKLQPYLTPQVVIQARVVLENLNQKLEPRPHFTDRWAHRPYPILEFPPPHYAAGTAPRLIYPLLEAGNFWPRNLATLCIDPNLKGDAYGESYASSLRLHSRQIKMILVPELIIRHPGALSGGSQQFHKQTMLRGFTPFHAAYFYNMIYLHSRWWPRWVWLWLPYFLVKSCLALIFNRQPRRWFKYALRSMSQSLWHNLWRRQYADA